MTKTEKSPLLSVVVPVYNGEDYLSGTLDSILASEYRELEVILIDDGSRDGSGQICQRYRQSDRRVRYIRTSNGGIVAARNRGMAEAAGEYLCFGDQDDQVDACMYARLMEQIQDKQAQIGICSTGRIIDGRKSLYESLTDGCFHGDEILTSVLYPLLFRGYDYPFYNKENYLYGSLWKCIFKLDLLKKHKMQFRSFVDYEDDWLFVTEALCYARTVVTVSEIGYYWRVNQSSKSHQRQFISGLGERYKQQDAWVMEYLGHRILDQEILELYRQIRMCEHYVELFQNEPHTGESRRAYYIEVSDYLSESNYREQLSCRLRLHSNAYRRRLISGSLLSVGIRGTFLMNRILSAGEGAAERIQWLARLERAGKLGKDKVKDSRRRQHEADHSDSML